MGARSKKVTKSSKKVSKGRKHLSQVGLAPRTLTLYRKHVGLFFIWLGLTSLAMPDSREEVDRLLGEYVNMLWQEGESIGWAGNAISGPGDV